MLFQNILCAVDFSDDSRKALQVAAELARRSQAALQLVHVWQVPVWLSTAEYELPNRLFQETIDAAERNLEQWKLEARKLGAPEVKASFSIGVPWDRIVGVANSDPRIDLIVTGTHGRTGLKHALIGSVAEKVVRHAPCPVLVVRARPS